MSAPRRPEGSGCGRFVCLGSSKHPFSVLIQRGEGGVFRRIEDRASLIDGLHFSALAMQSPCNAPLSCGDVETHI